MKGIPRTYFVVNTIDPTKTLTLRHRFVADFNRRFTRLMADIKEAIVDLDVFGLSNSTGSSLPTGARVLAADLSRGQFDFPTDTQKIDAFMVWLMDKIDEHLLEVRVNSPILDQLPGHRGSWMRTYLDSSYQQGIRRGRQELKKLGIDIQDGYESLMGRDPITTAFNSPMHADRAGMIYTRAYSSLKGITSAMDSTVSDVLAMGLIDGLGPRQMAQALNKAITGQGKSLDMIDSLGRFIPAKRRAQILARTEVVRAHHAANIGEYRVAQIQGIEILAEHLTAGDGRVCPVCAPLNGRRYTIDQAENIIPVHPQCRCVAIPYIPEHGPALPTPEPVPTENRYGSESLKPEFRAEYQAIAARYADMWEDQRTKMKGWYDTDSVWNPQNNMLRVESRDAIKELSGHLYGSDPWNWNQMIQTWQYSTNERGPMLMKFAAAQMEKRSGSIPYNTARTTYSPSIEQLKDLYREHIKDARLSYLHIKAMNQTYMEHALGMMPDDVFMLYRGTDGRTGELLAKKMKDDLASGRTKFKIDDPLLVGYTEDQVVADSFGIDTGGIVVEYEIEVRNTLIHQDLLTGITGSHASEKEFVLLGGKRDITAADAWLPDRIFERRGVRAPVNPDILDILDDTPPYQPPDDVDLL